jgi:hypothetical protein
VRVDSHSFPVELCTNLGFSVVQQPTLDDYERIPIEQFGLAMLRGMGWKKGEGIGLTNKRLTSCSKCIGFIKSFCMFCIN